MLHRDSRLGYTVVTNVGSYGIHAIEFTKKFAHFQRVNYTYDEGFCIAFGKRVREVRQSKGMTMKQLALNADVDYSQIARIERGVSNPTISTVYTLSKALDVPAQELFTFRYPTLGKKG